MAINDSAGSTSATRHDSTSVITAPTRGAAAAYPATVALNEATTGPRASGGDAAVNANAAAIAYPGRQVVAFVGDGGLSMLMCELATAVKYGLDVKIVVIKNDVLGQIKWEQMVFLGNPEYVCELQPIDFVTVARGFGVAGFRIDDPKDCADILRQALATSGPVVIEAIVDPNEPPMPPKVSMRQAKHFAESLVRGTPNARKIALTVLGDRIRELV